MNHLTHAENQLRNQSEAAIIGGQFDPNEVLLPYQKRWIADESQLKIAEKAAEPASPGQRLPMPR